MYKVYARICNKYAKLRKWLSQQMFVCVSPMVRVHSMRGTAKALGTTHVLLHRVLTQ